MMNCVFEIPQHPLSAWKCLIVDWCMNCDNLLTTNDTSGLIICKYCKLPTMRRKLVASAAPDWSFRYNKSDELRGVATPFASDICYDLGMSVI